MAYAAVTSLRHTINRFLKCGHDDIQIVENSSPEMIKLLEEEVVSLANVLERLDNNRRRFSSKRLNIALDAQIRDAVFKLEDVVESHLLHQFLSQSQNNIHQQHPFSFSLDIEELKPVIDSLIETMNKFKAEYINELSSDPLPKEEEDIIVESEPIMFGLLSNQMCTQIKDKMLEIFSDPFGQYALWGMAGIGKTTLARKLFQDPSISSSYDNRAFIKVGPEYELGDVLLDIIKQLDPDHTNHEKLVRHFGWWFKRFLEHGNCLIVLDDVWDRRVPGFLLESSRGRYGSFVCTLLITTRLQELSESIDYWTIPFLDKKESWDLLCTKVFGDQQDESSLCPSELKKAGKKIAENCEGLPLTILTVADILSKLEMTPELWNEVAANKQHAVYKEAYAKMHKVLLPSYYCLPQYLRICFLYMGVFPQNYEIQCTKLYMLWAAEGFILLEKDKYYHFKNLLINSVLIAHGIATYGSYKTVGLHSSFWYLCKKEAGKCKFFHSFTTLEDCLAQGIETQRRLCVYNPVLFAIKDASDTMASISTARSLLCTGVYHKYPVPVCLGSRLLRVLDALIIHFYEFPVEVLKLIQLRYFALTCDGELPPSISKLWNLMYLIVDRRLSIKSSDGAPSYLPVEIWDMKKLEHLQVMGSDLPKPPKGTPVLSKLLTLLDVSPHSCTRKILKRLPNLTKLGIQIELSPDVAVDQPYLGCFDYIRNMYDLNAFKCVVVNPRMMFEVVTPPPVPLPSFPRYLHKLTLSGLGYPWEEMSKISSMPKLRVLKLLSYAFRGPKWDVGYRGFPCLEVLVIEDTDLVQWTTAADYQIENLRLLSIKHCYNLKEIPTDFTNSLEKVEIVDCNPLALSSANKLKQDWDRKYSVYTGLDLKVHSSWDDQN